MSYSLNPFIAACQWIATGASQITIISTDGVRSARVNATTKQITFFFDGLRTIDVDDELIVTPAVGSTVALTGQLLQVAGSIRGIVLPVTGTVLQSGMIQVVRNVSQANIVST